MMDSERHNMLKLFTDAGHVPTLGEDGKPDHGRFGIHQGFTCSECGYFSCSICIRHEIKQGRSVNIPKCQGA